MAFFGKPLAYAFVNDGWGSDRSYRGDSKTHQGLDFHAPIGTPVFAIGSGKVITSKDTGTNTGKWIAIQHSSGIISRYMHLDTRLVEVGEQVSSGQQIATSGRTGITQSAAHLHLDLKKSGMAIPGEPLIGVDGYASHVIASAIKHGLPLAGKPIASALAIGAAIGGAYALWKYVIKPRGGLI